jgi:hypothetical protein
MNNKLNKMPSFAAEASLYKTSGHYRMTTRSSNNLQIIAQSKMVCAYKAGRLNGRCKQAGFDSGDCDALAADFNAFCNEHDL